MLCNNDFANTCVNIICLDPYMIVISLKVTVRDFQKMYRTGILNSDEISKFLLFEEVPRMIRPKKKICVFPVTRPTLIFPSDPNVFIGIPKKKKRNLPYLRPFFIGFATFTVIFEAVLLFKHLF